MPVRHRKNLKPLYYDYSVDVPYEKSPEGSVELFLRLIPEERGTRDCPGTPAYFEVVDWEGVLYDDDLPDLEDEAAVLIAERERIDIL